MGTLRSGLFFVALGTSLPELVVSVKAAAEGVSDNHTVSERTKFDPARLGWLNP